MSTLYNKYNITKTDGSPVDPNAMYFVLRLDTDPLARSALSAYAQKVEETDPLYAESLRALVAAGLESDLERNASASDSPPADPETYGTCLACGGRTVAVRPGKWQCENCE